MAKNISGLFEALSPSQEQKDKIFNSIASNAEAENGNSKPRLFARFPKSVTAVIVLALIICSVCITVNAATDGEFFSNVRKIVFQDGTGAELRIGENTASLSIPYDIEPEWLVSENSQQRLILSVSGEDIDITEEMNQNGYYYYDFTSEDDGLLHAIYIVKNAGEEEVERWYSQMESIPELGVSSSKGCSGALSSVLLLVEWYIQDGLGTIETELPSALELYWEVAETKLGEGNRWANIEDEIIARWGEWRD